MAKEAMSPSSKLISKTACKICKKEGHWAKDCYFRKDKPENPVNTGASSSSTSTTTTTAQPRPSVPMPVQAKTAKQVRGVAYEKQEEDDQIKTI